MPEQTANENGWDDRYDGLLRSHLGLSGHDTLDPDHTFTGYGLDSLRIISLLVDAEKAFAVTLPEELLAFDSLGTPRSLWNVLRSLSAPSQEGLPGR